MDADELRELFSRRSNFKNVDVPEGEKSPRERFFNIMEFKPVDRIIDCEFGYWRDTLRRWHHEGLPEYVNSNEKADVYFGFDEWAKPLPVINGIHPLFPEEIVERGERHTILYDANHVKCQVFTDGADTIPHYLDYPIKDTESYRTLFKERLLPKLAERIPQDIAHIGEEVKNRNYILQSSAGSTAGWIRNWMGFEGICYNLYDRPDLLEEMLDDISTLETAIAKEITKYLTVDLISYWEDIAFKNGPIVPPDFFYNKCGPVMKSAMDVFKSAGTKYAYVDCDGDMRKLVPTWLDHGVNIMFPLEVRSGVHPLKLREENEGIRMLGGVDKVVLTQGKDAIKKELQRLRPLVEEGGFIPHIDHRVQADVPYEDYLYYLEVKRDMFDLPNRVNSDR